jgi:dolichol kinase
MCYVGLTRFMTPTGVIVMASLVGDGIAAMIGIEYGKHPYRVHPLGGTKSVEGTLGCAFGTMGGIVFYSYMTGIDVLSSGGGGGGYGAVLATYGCISAIVEATALRNYDNMLLALAMEMTVKHYAKSGGGTP